MSPSLENKAVAKHAAKAFGGSPKVRNFYHDTEPLVVDILRCEDRPWTGVTSYSTIRLSDHPMSQGGHEFPTRLELAGACATAAEHFPSVLGSAAFCIMRTGNVYAPGSVLRGYVNEYFPGISLPHLYLTTPFLWDSLTTLDCGTKTVSWLLAMPISQSEYEYLDGNGHDALETLFEQRQIDIFDLARQSVV